MYRLVCLAAQSSTCTELAVQPVLGRREQPCSSCLTGSTTSSISSSASTVRLLCFQTTWFSLMHQPVMVRNQAAVLHHIQLLAGQTSQVISGKLKQHLVMCAGLPIQDFTLDPEMVAAQQAAVGRALPSIESATLSKTYVGFLGFYNSQGSLKWSKPHLVEVANHFSSIIGTACV